VKTEFLLEKQRCEEKARQSKFRHMILVRAFSPFYPAISSLFSSRLRVG
jgi:hypothetical protein